MKRRFMEEQIIKILQEGQGAITVGALCRSYAIAPATYYTWKNKFNGMTDLAKNSSKERIIVTQPVSER